MEYPEQDARTAPFQSEPKEKPLVRRETKTQYLESPEEEGAKRNLTLAITFLVLAVLGLWMGWYYAGGAAIRTMLSCLLTLGVVWLLMISNITRQRHGALFSVGLVALLGSLIPFVEGGLRKFDDLARERLAGQNSVTVPPPPVTVATAPPAPPTIPLPPEDPVLKPEPKSERVQSPSIAKTVKEPKKAPLKTKPTADGSARELLVPEPPPGSGKLIRVKEDVKVDLDGRPTIIRAGTVAPFKAFHDDEVTFLAGDSEISISSDLVMFTGASKESPEEITKLAHQEVMLRYPKIGEKDSRENILFVTRVKEMQLDKEMKDFFKDPKWPIILAEQLAGQENWVRADVPDNDAGATPDEPAVPANELPAEKDLLLPAGAPPVPQQAEPPPAK